MTTAPTEIHQLKVSDVQPNPNNARKKLTNVADLAKSIEAIGLIEPIVVRVLPSVNKFVVVAGHRRLAAVTSLKRETISAIIVDVTAQHEALSSLSENTSREDLTPEELADAVAHLSGLEVTDEEIARTLSIAESDLVKAKIISGASKATRTKAKRGVESRQLTLDQQAALIQFSGDPECLRQIRQTIEYRPEQLTHTIALLEANIARENAIAELTNALKLSKTKTIEFGHRGPEVGTEPLMNLLSSNGKKLTLANHKTCLGHVAHLVNIDKWDSGKPSVVFFCVNYKEHGHKMVDKPKMTWYGRGGTSTSGTTNAKPITEKEKAKATAERRAVIANNKAWDPASKVRTEWATEFMSRKSLDAAAKLWVLAELIIDPDAIVRTGAKVASSIEADFITVFGQLAQFREGELSKEKWRPYANSADRLSRYIAFLQSQGYVLSDVEKLLIKKEKKSA